MFTHPEVNVQVAVPAEFSITDLERDRHLVVLVELFVKAFFRVGLHLDIVGCGEAKQASYGGKDRRLREQHRECASKGSWKGKSAVNSHG